MVLNRVGVAPRRTPDQQDSQAAITEMFRRLAVLDPGSLEFRRLQDRIVVSCLPIADSIARRFAGRGETRDDLVQVARAGLVGAVKRYNVEAGTEFVAFAVPTIVGELKRHFRDNSWSVKVPRRIKELNSQLGPTSAALRQTLGREPTPAELAAELGVSQQDAGEALSAGRAYRTVPLDAPHSRDGQSIWETLGDPDGHLDQIEDRETLRSLLIGLPERERTVLLLRYFESLSQSQIASRVGISQMHVSRVLAKSLARLRSQLQPLADTA